MNLIGRPLWNAERFGLTPVKLRARLFDKAAPSIVSNSLPKAGTHLLERALCLHPRLYRPVRRTLHDGMVERVGDLTTAVPELGPGHVLVTHLSHTEEREQALKAAGVRSLFLVRDPRDIVISQANYVIREEKHSLHEAVSSVSDYQERLRRLITGHRPSGIPGLKVRLAEYAGWLNTESLLVRYEELIGAAGGGNADRQRAILREIFSFIGLEVNDQELSVLAARTFSSVSPTFRRGRIGQWREYFDETTLEIFEAEAGELAELYGYRPAESDTTD